MLYSLDGQAVEPAGATSCIRSHGHTEVAGEECLEKVSSLGHDPAIDFNEYTSLFTE